MSWASFTSLLSVAPEGSVSFISRFLKSADEEIQLEAASALAQSHDAQAIEILAEFWQEPLLSIGLRRAPLINLGASPLHEAAEFLLMVISSERPELAASAITALATSRFRDDIRQRAAAAVQTRNNSALSSAFERDFTQTAPL